MIEKPLEVFALNKYRQRVTGSIPYLSLQWQRRYYECGRFIMSVTSDIYSPDWEYIFTDDRPETGIIQKVTYSDTATTADGIDTVILEGYFLESLMSRRIFLEEKTREQTIIHEDVLAPVEYYYSEMSLWEDIEQGGWYTEKSEGKISGQDMFNKKAKTDEFGDPTGKYTIPTLAVPDDAVRDGDTITFTTQDTVKQGDKNAKVKTHHTLKRRDYTCQSNAYYFWYPVEEGADYSVLGKDTVTNTGVSKTEMIPPADLLYIEDKNSSVFYLLNGKIEKATKIVNKQGDVYSYGVKVNKVEEKRLIQSPWQLTEAKDPEAVIDPIKHLLKWGRFLFQNTVIWETPTMSLDPKAIDPSFKTYMNVLYDELKPYEMSFQVEYSYLYDTMAFRFWQGKDRTQSQTENTWVVFSDQWGMLSGYAHTKDSSNYKNKCYVLYEYEEPEEFDSNGDPEPFEHKQVKSVSSNGDITWITDYWRVGYNIQEGYVVARIEDGLPDMETYLDMRNEKPSCDDAWSRSNYTEPTDANGSVIKPTFDVKNMKAIYMEFPDKLLEAGMTNLKNNYNVKEVLDVGSMSVEYYLEDWDLGDKVDAIVSATEFSETARITGVDEIYESGKIEIKPIVGDEMLTNVQRAKLNG